MDQRTKDVIHLISQGVHTDVIKRLVDTTKISSWDLLRADPDNIHPSHFLLTTLLRYDIFFEGERVELLRAAQKKGVVFSYQEINFFQNIATELQKDCYQNAKDISTVVDYLQNHLEAINPARFNFFDFLDNIVLNPATIPYLKTDVLGEWERATASARAKEFISAQKKASEAADILRMALGVYPQKFETANYFERHPEYIPYLKSFECQHVVRAFVERPQQNFDVFARGAQSLFECAGKNAADLGVRAFPFLFKLLCQTTEIISATALNKEELKKSLEVLSSGEKEIFLSNLAMALPFLMSNSPLGNEPEKIFALFEAQKTVLPFVPFKIEKELFFGGYYDHLDVLGDGGFEYYTPDWLQKMALCYFLEEGDVKTLQDDESWGWFAKNKNILHPETKGYFNMMRQAVGSMGLFENAPPPSIDLCEKPSDASDCNNFYTNFEAVWRARKDKDIIRKSLTLKDLSPQKTIRPKI